MDLDLLVSIANIAKYGLIILGLIGLIMILAGKSRQQKNMITQGAYILILSIIFAVCGYFIYNITMERTGQKYEEVYDEYKNQYQQQR